MSKKTKTSMKNYEVTRITAQRLMVIRASNGRFVSPEKIVRINQSNVVKVLV